MKGRISEFLLYCQTADFGKGELSKRERTFYQRFSNEVLSLCRSVPESAQTDSMLFLMRYSGLNLGEDLDFFANYYPPIWSILYWLSSDVTLPAKRLKDADVTNAVTAQSMAMFLHSLDDHLIDGQVSISPLTLVLRTEAWTIMNRAFCNLAEGVPEGERTVRSFINDYYSSLQDPKRPTSLNGYCDLFRRQMGILMIAPLLLAMKMTGTSDFTRDIELAYGSFGIAWRLLDDVKDIGDDIEKGTESSIYLCLPEGLRSQWKNGSAGTQALREDSTHTILHHVLQHGLIETIKERICAELNAAAAIVRACNMAGLAAEFRCLAHPLRTDANT